VKIPTTRDRSRRPSEATSAVRPPADDVARASKRSTPRRSDGTEPLDGVPVVDDVHLTLAQWVDALGRPLTRDEIYSVALAMLDFMDAFHGLQFVPIGVAPNHLKVGDGRFSWTADDDEARHREGDVPYYCALEEYEPLRGHEGAFTDIYRAAAIIYYYMTGVVPPPANDRLLHDELTPLKSQAKRFKEFSPAFLEGIDWGLRVLAKDRPQGPSDWRTVLAIPDSVPNVLAGVVRKPAIQSVDGFISEANIYSGKELGRGAQERSDPSGGVDDKKTDFDVEAVLMRATSAQISRALQNPRVKARLMEAFGQAQREHAESDRLGAVTSASGDLGPPLPELSDKQLAAIARRAKQKPWSDNKSEYRGRVFEFVRDTYGEWIPGLLQSHLRFDQTGLYHTFAQALRRAGGLPAWLDLPNEYDALMRNAKDASERELIAMRRASSRESSQARRRLSGVTPRQ
jgi:hypothetical protein